MVPPLGTQRLRQTIASTVILMVWGRCCAFLTLSDIAVFWRHCTPGQEPFAEWRWWREGLCHDTVPLVLLVGKDSSALSLTAIRMRGITRESNQILSQNGKKTVEKKTTEAQIAWKIRALFPPPSTCAKPDFSGLLKGQGIALASLREPK